MSYYENKSHISCSLLKRAWIEANGGTQPEAHPESLRFGTAVDELLTDIPLKKLEITYSSEEVELAEIYKTKTLTPYKRDSKRLQWEFYKTLSIPFRVNKFGGNFVKMRGKTDIWYPKHSIVEDIKTTKIRTNSYSAISQAIDRFDYDMQIAVYMILSRSSTGMLSFLSRTGKWLHQVPVHYNDVTFKKGIAKFWVKVANWDKS